MQFQSIQTSVLLLVCIQCFIVDGAKPKRRHTFSPSPSSRAPMPGGYIWVNSSLPEVQHAAKVGVLLIGQVTNESRALKLLNVSKAKTQVRVMSIRLADSITFRCIQSNLKQLNLIFVIASGFSKTKIFATLIWFDLLCFYFLFFYVLIYYVLILKFTINVIDTLRNNQW